MKICVCPVYRRFARWSHSTFCDRDRAAPKPAGEVCLCVPSIHALRMSCNRFGGRSTSGLASARAAAAGGSPLPPPLPTSSVTPGPTRGGGGPTSKAAIAPRDVGFEPPAPPAAPVGVSFLFIAAQFQFMVFLLTPQGRLALEAAAGLACRKSSQGPSASSFPKYDLCCLLSTWAV